MEGDGAAHQDGEGADDGEAEAGAAEAACGGDVGLFKFGEEAALGVGWDADAGVGDGEVEVCGGAFDVVECEAGGDGAALGEVEGVAEEVGDDLAEAGGVADEGLGDVGGDVEGEAEFFGLGVESHGLDEGLELGARGEGDGFEGEFAGLEFGGVEDVVEEAEEVEGAFMGDFGVVAVVGR